MDNSKLTAIEETIAHQDQQLADLSEMVIHQGEEIAALKRHIGKLEGKLETLKDSEAQSGHVDIADQKPPHY